MPLLHPRPAAAVLASSCRPRATANASAALSFLARPSSPPITPKPPTKYPEFRLPREMPAQASPPTRGDAELADFGGVSITATDDHAPAAALAILVPCSARHEGPDTRGAASIMKNSAFLSKQGMTAYYIAYESENRGIRLDCAVGREHMIYTATFLRDNIDFATKLLAGIVQNPNGQAYAYKNAIENSRPFLGSYWANNINTAIESLYACAFRNSGLGNATELEPNGLTPSFDAYNEFAQSSKVLGKGAVISALGIGFEELKLAAQNALNKAPPANKSTVNQVAPQAARYYGGSSRILRAGSNVIAVAFDGARAAETKDRAALELISTLVLGTTGQYSPFRGGYSRMLDQMSCRAINDSYSDAGLFGFVVESEDTAIVTAESKRIVDALRQVASGKHEGLSSEPAFEGAKRRAALRYAERTSELRLPGAIEQARAKVYGYHGANTTISQQLLGLKSGDVAARAKALLGKNSSLSVVGQLSKLPYAEDLQLPTASSGGSR